MAENQTEEKKKICGCSVVVFMKIFNLAIGVLLTLYSFSSWFDLEIGSQTVIVAFFKVYLM